ncbi:hypothetical protein ASPCAL14852 [Aspergillus calidoustus]|uniref:Uncharacterized protein n=1 Tax=Aspergillus calidoustus TaxID=454130 RepID=A0A0U5GI61_ASPCI|nr:hypothetical protein ASPCAL14852 [Aspergillus calidoustus]
MAEALGVAGIAYPIAKDLVTLAQKMERAYKKMRHAKADVKEIMKRTETVALTYNFYQDTMDEAKQIPELEPMFKKHRKLMRKITTETTRLIDTLEDFVQFFWFDLHDSPVELIERWIARLDWYRQSSRVIPPLFYQLGVFEGSMRTVAALIGVQMARQIQSFTAMLRIDFDKLQKAQQAQQQFFEQQKTASHNHNSDRNHFGEKVIRSLKKEISRVPKNRPPDSPSSMDSAPPPSSPTPDHPSRLTPPSSLPSQGSGDAIFPTEVVDLAEDEEAPSEQKTSSGPVSAPIHGREPRLTHHLLNHQLSLLPPAAREPDPRMNHALTRKTITKPRSNRLRAHTWPYHPLGLRVSAPDQNRRELPLTISTLLAAWRIERIPFPPTSPDIHGIRISGRIPG